MPPKEPLIYRLYEIVQNYGYAYKAVLNEKFGDGIMSAISFSTNVKKETDDKVSCCGEVYWRSGTMSIGWLLMCVNIGRLGCHHAAGQMVSWRGSPGKKILEILIILL